MYANKLELSSISHFYKLRVPFSFCITNLHGLTKSKGALKPPPKKHDEIMLLWKHSLMFLVNRHGYWQELIESIIWSTHNKLKVTQPRALIFFNRIGPLCSQESTMISHCDLWDRYGSKRKNSTCFQQNIEEIKWF